MKRLVFITFCFVMCQYAGKNFGTFLESPFNDDRGFLDKYFVDPDAKRNVSELFTSKGYPVEEHVVQTTDGYLLSVQRIVHGRNGNTQENRRGVVLLIHGEFCDAAFWVLNFPNQSLGFILPDNGYDVWLLNNRGSRYSKKHVQYRLNEYRFWNYSFDEMGRYDVPNTIDYILETTDEDGLYVVAHSRGGSATLAMLSDMPEYNKKVKLFIALAPGAFLGHTTSAARALLPLADGLFLAFNALNNGEFVPDNEITRRLRGELCAVGVAPELCEVVIFAITGVDRAQLNKTRLNVYASHLTASTSVKSLYHFAQIIKTNKYRKFDYGLHDNLRYYHQEEPPDYDLSSITTPIALFWSTNDAIVVPKDIDILRKKLNSLVFDYCIPYPYNHIDFGCAMNALKVLHEPILQCLAEY